MAKWHGNIGFAVTAETRPGVWEEQITTRSYSGDLTRNGSKLQASNQLNDNIVVMNEISIIADPFANENIHAIRYVGFMGTKWKVEKLEVRYPRLIMTLGGVYNG